MTINQRKTRSVVLLGGLSFLTFVSVRQFATTGNAQSSSAPSVQNETPEGDTNGIVPGNSANAVQDLQQIYKLVGTYRNRNGTYPPSAPDLVHDLREDPEVYGYSEEARHGTSPEAFHNPDYAYADGNRGRSPKIVVPYMITNQRPDGTLVGTPKSEGQKDVLGYTDIYIHRNIHHLPKSRTTENPVGSFVVLWDDGTVTQVPYDQQLYVPEAGSTPRHGSYTTAFPGQAGVPANVLTYDQFYQSLGWKKGPRGKEGGPGLAYDTYK